MTKSLFSVVVYSLLLLFSMSSCTSLMSKMYGINQIEGVNEVKIQQFYSSIDFKDIQTEKIIIDSLAFQSFREHENDSIKKDLSQPIQIHYFENLELASFHANCYAKGSMKNLDWNYQQRFDSFIPRSAVKDLTEYPHFTKLNELIEEVDLSSEKEIVIVIFWTRMLEDISKDAINTVLKNIGQFSNEDEVQLVIINTDSFFSKI